MFTQRLIHVQEATRRDKRRHMKDNIMNRRETNNEAKVFLWGVFLQISTVLPATRHLFFARTSQRLPSYISSCKLHLGAVKGKMATSFKIACLIAGGMGM